jgi:hypothetical protein
MLKLSSFDNQDLVAIQSDEIEVRLTIDDPIKLANQKVRLKLKFEFADSSIEAFEFRLSPTKEPELKQTTAWFSRTRVRRSYRFKLTRLAQLEFANLQKTIKSKAKIEKYYWTVFYYLIPHQETGATIDVELKLADDKPFFYLLDGALLKIDKT